MPGQSKIFITGASGFVGRHLIGQLDDHPVRALSRRNTPDLDRRQHVETWNGDVTDVGALRGAMDAADTVIHLAAIIEETGKSTFDSVIREGTEHVVAEAKRAGVHRFIHLSALGVADNPRFPYLQAKWRAEQAVINSGIDYTILRPSVIFGPGDGFISTLANVVRTFPIVPIVGDGLASFQPIHVIDVAACIAKAVDDPVSTSNVIAELGGGSIHSYEEIVETISHTLNLSRFTINVPVPLMKLAVRMARPLPRRLRPPVTLDQIAMLELDIVPGESATRKLLGVAPRALEDDLDYIRQV